MGASASGGWLFSSDDAAQIVLSLNDARWLGLLQGEELSAVVYLSPDDTEVTHLNRTSPAQLTVPAATTLGVEFQACFAGRQDTARCLGEVQLPLAHVARRFGGHLYQTWLPLEPSSRRMHGAASSSSSSGPNDAAVEKIERALRSAAKDPRFPMVCLSLCHGTLAQVGQELFTHDVPPAEKASRFIGLLQSHTQHVRILQALYRHVRNRDQLPQQMLPHFKDALIDSWATDRSRRLEHSVSKELPHRIEELTHHDHFRFDGEAVACNKVEDELSRLRDEIKSTTAEANLRINQASDAVRTLKERISSKQVELIQKRKEVSRLWHDAESLELDNEKLQLQLQRLSSRSNSDDAADEVSRLRQEAKALTTQKEALVLILQDVYGAIGKEPSKASTPQPSVETLGASSKKVEEEVPQQLWTNLLPRPSELLASSILEERASLDY